MVIHSIREVCKTLKLSRPTVEKIIKRGELKTVNITVGKRSVTDEALQEYINKKTKGL